MEDEIKQIKNLFKKYSVEDLLNSLFVSSVWVPNLSTPITHLFLYAIVLSEDPKFFSNENKIKTYMDFKKLMEGIDKYAPRFPMLQDFIPETDWGEIKYHMGGDNIPFLYGGDFATSYDYLQQHELVYKKFRDKLVEKTKRDPLDEMKGILLLHSDLINTVDQDSKKIEELRHFEIPPEKFWTQCITYLKYFDPIPFMSPDSIKALKLSVGKLDKKYLNDIRLFQDSSLDGTLLPYFFIKHKTKLYPLLPRRYIGLLRDMWGRKFFKYIDYKDESAKSNISLPLQEFIQERVTTDESTNMQLVSATYKDNKPHEILYELGVLDETRFVLFYLLPPLESAEEIQEYLEGIKEKLNKSIELLSSKPCTLSDHLHRRNIQFEHKDEEAKINPTIVLLNPAISPDIVTYTIPKDIPAQVFSLVDFIAIIDEIDDPKEVVDFINYLEQLSGMGTPMASTMDKFGSFKDSGGVMIPGANEPDFILLDFSWGSHYRYQSLKDFWKSYGDISFFGHPKSWKIDTLDEICSILISKNRKVLVYITKIDTLTAYITYPFEYLPFEEGKISDFLSQLIQGYLRDYRGILSKHNLISRYSSLHVIVFSKNLVASKENFKHVKHLIPEKLWKSDAGILNPGDRIGVRIVFDQDNVIKFFKNRSTRARELKFFKDFIEAFDSISPDTKVFNSLGNVLQNDSSKSPRFQLNEYQKEASFPELASYIKPKTKDYKSARKIIAKHAKDLGISEGYYKLEDAKEKVDKLIGKVVTVIDSEIKKYNYDNSISTLIENINALMHIYTIKRNKTRFATEAEVDYDLIEDAKKTQSDYLDLHKNYRYLIEKFVQFKPKGKEYLSVEKIKELLGLIDWIQVLYSASDSLHYGVGPFGLKVDRDFVIDTDYGKDFDKKQDRYVKYLEKIKFGGISNKAHSVEVEFDESMSKELDNVFMKDLGFRYSTLVSILNLLTFWAVHDESSNEQEHYVATIERIIEVAKKEIKDSEDEEELNKAIAFITLRSENITLSKKFNDIPISEHNKRLQRYPLKPLLVTKEGLMWGPYMTRQTAMIWQDTIWDGYLPVQLDLDFTKGGLDKSLFLELSEYAPAKNISGFKDKLKKQIEDKLESKAEEILKDFSKMTTKNVFLHKRFPKEDYDKSIGDYDVLSYHSSSNTVVIVDCNDIVPAYTPKDSVEVRRKIFEEKLPKMQRREQYLKDNCKKIFNNMGWEYKDRPKVVSIYVSRRIFWWTFYPPIDTDIVFTTINVLENDLTKILH